MQKRCTGNKPTLGRTGVLVSEDPVGNPSTITVGYCVYKSCHLWDFSIMICEMRGGQGWWRKRINCKVLCSYKATPLAPAAPSSVGLSTEEDGSVSGRGSSQSRSEAHQH